MPRVFSSFPSEQVTVDFDGMTAVDVSVMFSISTGTFSVEYLIEDNGSYSMNVKVDGQHISGSPYLIDIVADVGPAHGPTSVLTGLSNTVAAGASTSLVVQLVDRYGSFLEEGGDDVTLVILDRNGQVAASQGFNDLFDGSYTVDFTLTTSGVYVVNATVNGAAIATSPWTLVVLASETSATLSRVSNLQPTLRAGEQSTFIIHAFDEFNNSNTEGVVGADFSARIDGTDVMISHISFGEYSATFGGGLRASNEPVLISVLVGTNILHNFPQEITVLPGTPVAGMTTASGSGLSSGIAGEPSQVLVTSRDLYGSACNTGGAAVALSFLSFPDRALVHSIVFIDNGDGTYSAEFQLEVAGRYSLQIALDGDALVNASHSDHNCGSGQCQWNEFAGAQRVSCCRGSWFLHFDRP